MTIEKLKETIRNCPKTIRAYTAYLETLKPNDSNLNINESLVNLSIVATPSSMLYWLDSVEHIGGIGFDYMTQRFELSLNGVAIEDEENNETDPPIMGSHDRKEAELKLINYILLEVEKTL